MTALLLSHVERDGPTTLYRHWASDGSLLYVGISRNESARRQAHRAESVWFPLVDRITLEEYATRRAAEAAERHAIINEQPQFNIIHAPWPQRRAAEQRRRALCQPAPPRTVVTRPKRAARYKEPATLPWHGIGLGDPCAECGDASQWVAQRRRLRTERRRPWVPLCTTHAVKEWEHQPDAQWFSVPRLVLYSGDMYVRPHDHLRYLVRLDGIQNERAWSFANRARLGRFYG